MPASHAKYPYRLPLRSLGEAFGEMPLPAQNTVRAEAGGAEIADVIKLSTADKVYYKIVFKQFGHFPPLFVGADGSVLYPDLTVAVPAPIGRLASPGLVVIVNDLPPDARKALQDRAGSGEVEKITKELWGAHVVYVVSFKNPEQHPKLYIASDGVVLTKLSR